MGVKIAGALFVGLRTSWLDTFPTQEILGIRRSIHASISNIVAQVKVHVSFHTVRQNQEYIAPCDVPS